MKRYYGVTIVVLALCTALGCAGARQTAGTKTARGAAIGAATGALAGAVIGHQSGHKAGGAILGGIAGAAIGGGVGYEMDKQAKELERIPDTRVTRQEDRLVVTMSDAVLFDVDSAALKPDARGTIEKLGDVMKRYADTGILVKGHTDGTGSEKYNQDLSERRAQAVTNFLIGTGVPAGRITAIGFGETMPVAPNDTADGRQRNRRVEIEIKPGPGAAS